MKWDDGNTFMREERRGGRWKTHISCRLIQIRLMIRELATSWIKLWNLMFHLPATRRWVSGLWRRQCLVAVARLLHTSLHSICWLARKFYYWMQGSMERSKLFWYNFHRFWRWCDLIQLCNLWRNTHSFTQKKWGAIVKNLFPPQTIINFSHLVHSCWWPRRFILFFLRLLYVQFVLIYSRASERTWVALRLMIISANIKLCLRAV